MAGSTGPRELKRQAMAKSNATETELDMNAQIAGMLAGRNVDLHAGIVRGGELLALSAIA